MVRRIAFACLTLIAASTMHAAYTPTFESAYVQLRPGETRTMLVHASWTSGVSYFPFQPWSFTSEDPTIATVDAHLETSWPPRLMTITAMRPGVTQVRITGAIPPPDQRYMTIVVAEQELPVTINAYGSFMVDTPVTLTAISDEPDATFTWFQGWLGTGWTPATGPQYTFTSAYPFPVPVWVLMTTPRGAGTAVILVPFSETPLRRRAIRH